MDWLWSQRVVEWVSAIGELGIVAAILFEGRTALREYRNAKLFEAIKYIEDDKVRNARRVLYEKLIRTQPAEADWWDKDEPLASAAARTCAMYNLLGAVTREDSEIRTFVVTEWANNIRWTHEALKTYIAYRERAPTGRPGMFKHYTALNDQAEHIR